jgi:hypothetical protein
MNLKKEFREVKESRWIIILVLTFLFLRLPSLFEPLIYGDEGIYLTLGLAVRKGLTLYKDIHDNKPPLLYLLTAVSGNILNFRLLLFFWSLGTIYVFNRLTKLLFVKNEKAAMFSTIAFGILTSLRMFEGNIANAENFMIGTTIAGLYLYLKAKRNWQYLLVGLLFSLSTLFKMPALFDFAVLFFFIFLTDKKLLPALHHILYTILGFILPISLTVIYYFSKNALGYYIKAAFMQNVGYLSSWGEKTGPSSLPLPLIFRGLIILGVIIWLFLFRKKYSNTKILTILWFAFSMFAALLSARPYPHYLIQILPPLSLSVGLFIGRTKEKIIPVIFLATLTTVFIIFKFWYYPNLPYLSNYYAYLLKFKNQDQYFNFFDPQTNAIYQTAAYIRTRTNPTEKIFVWGDQPAIYALSDRLPIGRYTVTYHIKDFNGWQEAMRAISDNPPRYLISITEIKESFPALSLFLSEKYRLQEQFGQIKIFHKIYQ